MTDFTPDSQSQLIDALIETGLLNTAALRMAQASTPPGQTVIGTLQRDGVLSERDVAMGRSLQLSIPLIDLKRHTVQASALALIPESVARRYTAIPLDIVGGELVVVMEDPSDIQAIDDLAIRSGIRIRPALGLRNDIAEALDLYYQTRGEIERQLVQIRPEPQAITEPRLSADLVTQNPVARVIELLIEQAIRDRASDIHVTPELANLRVRYRIDGILHDALSIPPSAHGALISRIKVLAGMNIAERRRPQDGQFTFQGDDSSVDIRVATAETVRGEMAVLRLLDKSPALLELGQLGFLPNVLAAYERLYTLPFGMVLSSGPTGAGKTTTLYATLNRLNRNETNTFTIEDPVEYQLDRTNQIQVNRQAGITFATGLKAIMRMDPNVILVGEIRDAETAEIAVQAALTGHLVLSTIHANEAVGTLYRLIDLGVEPYLVASALAGVVAQRLVRRVCPHCSVSAEATPAERLAYELEMGSPPEGIRRGQGCNFCSGTGYRGRTGVFEALSMTESLRHLVINGAPTERLKEQAITDGMVPMRKDGMVKVSQGLTTPHEIMRNVYVLR